MEKDLKKNKEKQVDQKDKETLNGYDHRTLEPKWEKKWEDSGIYKAIDFDLPRGKAGKKTKKYILFEFPYPSGDRLHVGHGRSYTALDAMARKLRMQGYNVMLPMGWDAFGLPTENYAIKNKVNPSIVTKTNINHAKEQAKRWGLSIDWDREIDTTDPNYYKWTQWIFIQLFKKGLAYREEVTVNWCSFCKTNLANEEVLSDGTHERCGNKTEKRMQKQWVLRITKYADRLIDDLREIDFLSRIAQQQINWIGRSEGAQIEFKVQNAKLKVDKEEFITVFTTRPDTLYGSTFMVLAPEHEIVASLLNSKIKSQISNLDEIKEYVEKTKMKTEIERAEEGKEKSGVFSGLYATNPATEKEIPIWISDFVLSSYGTGAIMSVPAHDQRDWEFAKKYGLGVVPVIVPQDKKWDFEKEPYLKVEEGITINSLEWNGLSPSEAIKKAISWLEGKGIGKKEISYHLRDWVFSRQHYWGEPIPMIFCQKCAENQIQDTRDKIQDTDRAGWFTVPEDQLPVELPYLEQYEPSGTGESPLSKVEEWVNTTCPKCGRPAKRETDTMPNWAGSNWYYVAYLFGDKLQSQNSNIKNQKLDGTANNIFSENKELLKYWLPVDLYNGGMEHTTLHLLYSRFIYKFLYDIGVVPTKEPYQVRRSHGMVLGPDGQKMSKSKGNVINPDEVIQAFGADAYRLYESFMGPFDQVISWNPESLEGCYRFLKRVWNLVINRDQETGNSEQPEKRTEILRKLNQTIKKVGEDIDNMKFNTAVAGMMELVNEISNIKYQISKTTRKNILEKLLLILAPFAPHITEELWEKMGNQFSIHQQKWPEYNTDLLEEDVFTMAVMVNGKLRGTIEVQKSNIKDQNYAENMARENKNVSKYLEGKEIVKVIYIPNKVINFVVR